MLPKSLGNIHCMPMVEQLGYQFIFKLGNVVLGKDQGYCCAVLVGLYILGGGKADDQSAFHRIFARQQELLTVHRPYLLSIQPWGCSDSHMGKTRMQDGHQPRGHG